MRKIDRLCLLLLCTSAAVVDSETRADADATIPPSGSDLTPDLRNDETVLKLQKGDFVVVPIPISNLTLDTGLVVGGPYTRSYGS